MILIIKSFVILRYFANTNYAMVIYLMNITIYKVITFLVFKSTFMRNV